MSSVVDEVLAFFFVPFVIFEVQAFAVRIAAQLHVQRRLNPMAPSSVTGIR